MYFIYFALVLLLISACAPEDNPLQQTQTAISIQQQQIELTQTFLSIGITQTAVVNQQFALETQLAPTLSPRDAAYVPVQQNTNWTPYEELFDGVRMVLVPVGCFDMGSEYYNGTQPVHEICFDQPFWIDKFEVTNEQFNRLNGVAENPGVYAGNMQPRENITWFESRDFCILRGGRLPTEAEWEYAARGPDNLMYAWGNDWDENNVSWQSRTTMEVGSTPTDTSWVGAMDMSGNIWERVSSLFIPYPYNSNDGRENSESTNKRVMRGGSFISGLADGFRVVERVGYIPEATFSSIGFRCVRAMD